MNIIILTKNYGKGYTGAMTSTYELIKRWNHVKKIKIIVLTLHIVGKINKGVKIKKFNGMVSLLNNLSKYSNKNSIGYSDDHFGFLFHIFGFKYIHTYHGNWPDNMFNGINNFLKSFFFIPLYILTIYFASYVGSVSEHSIKFISCFNKHYYLIRNGINVTKNICFINKIIKLKTKLNIIMVGNINKRKFKLLPKMLYCIPKNILKHVKISIFGSVYNHKLANKLESLGVLLKGFFENVPYNKYDLFLSTSKSENLSIASVEAISNGLPIITFNINGMNEIINNYNTGIIISGTNYRIMAKCISNIVHHGIIFNFNNKYVLEKFNWSKSSKIYLGLFYKVRDFLE